MRKTACFLVSLALCGMFVPAAQSSTLPPQFTLSRYVPADFWMVIHAVNNPERAWVDAQWERVWDSFMQSGALDEVKTMFMGQLGEEDRAQAEQVSATFLKLFEAVDWGKQFGGEFVYAQRLTFPVPDYLLLMRPAEGTAEANAKGMADIFKWLTGFGGIVVNETEMQGAKVWSMASPDQMATLALFQKGDVNGIVTGSRTLREVLSLLAGSGGPDTIIDSPKFKQALGLVPPPEGAVMYFNASQFLEALRGMMMGALQQAGPDDTEAAQWVKVVGKLMDLADVMEYAITTVEFDGRRDLTHSVCRIKEGKENSPLLRIFTQRKPFERFDKYIPAEATSFSINGSIDIEALYQLVVNFIEKDVPDGAEAIAEWHAFLASTGFSPQNDIFSWWGGEMISVSLPAATPTPMGGGEGVLMIRVKDGKLALEKVNALLNKANTLLQGNQLPPLMITPAKSGREGFCAITHPMVMMWGVTLAIGVDQDWLMIGSAAGVERCLAVAAGKAPSILTNERFREEGLVPKGPVSSCSFSDLSNLGQDLAMGVGMASMFGNMAVAGMPQNGEDERQAKAVLQGIFGILTRLTPVLQQIDFFSSSSSLCTRDGLNYHTEAVTAYKPPTKVKASPTSPTATAESASK